MYFRRPSKIQNYIRDVLRNKRALVGHIFRRPLQELTYISLYWWIKSKAKDKLRPGLTPEECTRGPASTGPWAKMAWKYADLDASTARPEMTYFNMTFHLARSSTTFLLFSPSLFISNKWKTLLSAQAKGNNSTIWLSPAVASNPFSKPSGISTKRLNYRKMKRLDKTQEKKKTV